MNNSQQSAMEKLLTRLIDSYDGYQTCCNDAAQSRHKSLFQDFGNTRQKFAGEIRELMGSHGVETDDDGSFLAKAHRYFVELKHKLDPDDDEELMEEILRGEGTLLSQYDDTISEFKSDQAVLEILQRQRREIQNNYSLIEAKEEAA